MSKIICNEDFNIGKIAESGQSFRLLNIGPSVWRLVAMNKVLYIKDLGDERYEFICSDEDFKEIWTPYFDLDTDYSKFRNSVPGDDIYLTAAVDEGRGIRILRQDPWEMLITFIISQRKNIPAIRSSVEKICRLCGEKIIADGPLGKEELYAFPTAAAICGCSEKELKDCGLGYRVPYIQKSAEMVANGEIDLAALRTLDYEELFEKLQCFSGVGPKVANCVALFAYYKIDAFPVDVWIGRMVDEHYGGNFPFELYKGYAGVMQQYIFYNARGVK